MSAFLHESPLLACGCLVAVCATVAYCTNQVAGAIETAFRRWGTRL